MEELPREDLCERGDTIEVIKILFNRLSDVCIENVPGRNGGGKRKGACAIRRSRSCVRWSSLKGESGLCPYFLKK